jgi:hypothetical protein
MAKSSFGTSVYGPDTSFIEGAGNIASMFDPRVEAQAALNQAHRDYYGNQGRLAAANAVEAENRNNALSTDNLLAAGYTPMEIAAFQGTGTKSVTDLFKGRNLYQGGRDITSSDPNVQRAASFKLGTPGATNANAAFNEDQAAKIRAAELASKIALEQSKSVNVPLGNTLVTLNPDGSATPRYESNINVGPGYTLVSPTSTGVSTLFKSDVPVKNNVDNVRAAENKLALQDKLSTEIIAETSAVDSTGRNYVNQPSQDQVRSISAYAVKLIEGGMSPQDAKNQSALAHGVKLNPQSVVAETTPGRLWGENNTGRYLLKGFHPPVAETPATSNLSNTVVPAVPAQAVTAPAPATQSAPAVIKATTQAQIDNAPSGAIIEVNGKRFRKP